MCEQILEESNLKKKILLKLSDQSSADRLCSKMSSNYNTFSNTFIFLDHQIEVYNLPLFAFFCVLIVILVALHDIMNMSIPTSLAVLFTSDDF